MFHKHDASTAIATDAPGPVIRGKVLLSEEKIPLKTLLLLPAETATQYRVIVFRDEVNAQTQQRSVALACEQPTSQSVQHLARYLYEHNHLAVSLFEADPKEIDQQLTRYAQVEERTPIPAGEKNETTVITPSPMKDIDSKEQLEAIIQKAIIPNIVTAILNYALVKKASDVHIEPLEESVRIRYRLDGVLVDIANVPRYFRNALISRIKVLAQMKIDESRIPQDGRSEFDFHAHTIDIRVSTLPTVHGEKMVLRLLDKDAGIMTLEQLGITGSTFDTLVKAINRPYGVILATGPTGSGKTTTLYAMLQRLTHPDTNIVTLEDPVEYEIPGINQSQVKPAIGYTFAEGLRAVLRQDPNVIMVGEVRDLETASMMTHAALTGHLVLSSLHTNDASGALLRLVNMGVEPFLLTSSINAILAQRLVRKLCVACRQQVELPKALLDEIRGEMSTLKSFPIANESEYTFYKAVGCGECTDGYTGRIGIYEVLTMSDTLESLVVSRQPGSVIADAAKQEGMITLKQDGILKALKGITTIDEVWRVTAQS